MQPLIDFSHTRFAVIGLGDTGVSIIEYLRYKKSQLVKVLDTRENPPHQDMLCNMQYKFGPLDIKELSNVDVIVLSPGVSIYEPVLQEAISCGIHIVGDIELFALEIKDWPSRVIGISGSNGKTTVTTLTGYLASQTGLNTLVAGNIGEPVLTSYIKIMETGVVPQLIVLELSSFQLETTYSLHLDSATVLNISEDHLDRYVDLLEYAYAKSRIFAHSKAQVLNSTDPLVMAMKRENQEVFLFAGSNAGFCLEKKNGHDYLYVNQVEYLDCAQLNLVGVHNYLNCLAVLALLKGAGLDLEHPAIRLGLESFQGLEHRMQKVVEHNGVLFIEDSKGTNVGAVIAGVSGVGRPVHLILGGDGKGQDFTPLRALVAQYCKSVAIIGQDKDLIGVVLEGLDLPIMQFMLLDEAVDFCAQNATSGDAVVLSPACASWDMFKNYKERAQVFIQRVNLLTGS